MRLMLKTRLMKGWNLHACLWQEVGRYCGVKEPWEPWHVFSADSHCHLPSSSFHTFSSFLSFSLTHSFSRTYWLFLTLTRSSGSLKVITSLRPVWRASVISHSSFPRPARSFWGKVFPTGPSMQGNVHFSVCFCFLPLIWDDLFEESVIAVALGIRELPVLMLIWQTLFFFFFLTSGGNRAALFPQHPCSTGITWVQWGLGWRKTW